MDEQKRGKKRPKSYYLKCAAGGKKHNRSTCIEPGMKGFLITCNKYERETVREMYNILNEYADKLYGPEQNKSSDEPSLDSDSSSEEEDMEKAMAKETAALKQASTQQRRFQNTNTKTKNVIFIRTTVDDPCNLAHGIFEDMYATQVQKARYAQRIIPVSIICKVDSKTISTAMETVLAPHFETKFGVGVKYTAVCKIRNNNTMSRNILLPLLNRIIQEMNPLHQLCHDEPDLVVVVEIMRAVCCLSVVKDFYKFRKYNFHEIVKRIEKDHSDVKDADVDKETKECDTTEVKVGEEGSINVHKNELDNVTTACNESVQVTIEHDNNEVSSEIVGTVGGVKEEEDKENTVESSLENLEKDNEKLVEANRGVGDICEETTPKLDSGVNAEVCKTNVVSDIQLSNSVENT